MGKKRKKLVFLIIAVGAILSLLLPAEIWAKNGSLPRRELFDLAEISPGSTVEKNLADGKIDAITFLNMYSESYDKYEMRCQVEIMEVPPLPKPVFRADTGPKKPGCPELDEAVKAFQSLTDSEEKWLEQKVRDEILSLQVLVDKCKKPNEVDQENITRVRGFISGSSKTFELGRTLNIGEKLIITLSRDDKEWNFVFKYRRGQWLTYYGFSLVSMHLRGHDQYFLKESEDSQGGYQLLPERKPELGDLDYIPTVFFTWMPFKRMSKAINHGFTGGLGIDMKSPVLFAGYSIVFNYNIGLNFGVIFHKQYQLKPKYHSDTEPLRVDSILSFDELHRGVFRPNISIGICFRFDSNPFAGAKE